MDHTIEGNGAFITAFVGQPHILTTANMVPYSAEESLTTQPCQFAMAGLDDTFFPVVDASLLSITDGEWWWSAPIHQIIFGIGKSAELRYRVYPIRLGHWMQGFSPIHKKVR